MDMQTTEMVAASLATALVIISVMLIVGRAARKKTRAAAEQSTKRPTDQGS